jgi:Beta protein
MRLKLNGTPIALIGSFLVPVLESKSAPPMSPHGHNHYVPFLKGKQGEFNALSKIDRDDREHLTPLIEIGPIEIDPKTGANAESLDEALACLDARMPMNFWIAFGFAPEPIRREAKV